MWFSDENMMWLVAAFMSAFVFGISGFLLKVGSHRKYHRTKVLCGLYLIGSAVFLIPLFFAPMPHVTWMVIFFSLLIGMGSYYGNSFLIKAYDLGPACLTSPLVNVSVLLVILMSVLFYKEKLQDLQYVGITCMVMAVSLLGCNFKNSLIKSPLWVVFVILTILFIFMREGGLKIAQENGLNNFVVLFFGYVFAFLMTLFDLNKNKIFHNKSLTIQKTENGYLLGSIMGVLSASGLMLLAYAINHGPASIVIPVFSTRNFVAVSLLIIYFKEKISRLQWLAVALLMLGVLLIS